MKKQEHPARSPILSLRSSSCRSPRSYQEELNSLPSLSPTSEESSNTLTSEEIARLLNTSNLINKQVELRLRKFVARSSSAVLKLNETEKKSQSIVVGYEHIREMCNQHEYILSLVEQASLLQFEVENTVEVGKFKGEGEGEGEEGDTVFEGPVNRKGCSLDRCGINQGASCSCVII